MDVTLHTYAHKYTYITLHFILIMKEKASHAIFYISYPSYDEVVANLSFFINLILHVKGIIINFIMTA